MKTITIFTPTYNRAHLLPRLYDSLCNQTQKNFEWLIVDDGSTDNTKEVVQSFIDNEKLRIIYYKQENGGKHRAINSGLNVANGELFFIVDSDDYLPKNCLAVINKKSSKIKGDIIGIVGRKQYQDHKIIGDEFLEKEFISDHIEKTYIKGIKGDLAEVVKTDYLRECKFPDFPGEFFCAEGLMWNRLITLGKLYFFDRPIYTAEYLEGGLSANSIINRRKSPTYAMQLYSELVKDERLPFFMKVRTYINFWRFSFFSNMPLKKKWNKIDNDYIGFLCLPLGWMMKKVDNIKLQTK